MSEPPEIMPDLTVSSAANSFWREAGATLRFEYFGSAPTVMEPGYETEWRLLPFLLAAQIMDGPNVVDFAGGPSWNQKPGEGVCIGPGILHNGRNLHPLPNLSRWAHVNFYVFGSVNLGRLINLTFPLDGDAAQRVGAINLQLEALESSGISGNLPELTKAAKRHSLGLELLACLLESSPPQTVKTPWAELERLAPVLNYIENHLDESHSREDLARLIHVSPSRFSALFKSTIGAAPGEYVQQLQLQRAQTLLLTTDATVAEIALRCGHPDPFHFSRLFKRYAGSSPAIYRRRVRLSLQ